MVSWLFTPSLIAQSVVLNEVVASNDTYSDEDGDTPDWFELYNSGDLPQSLSGWSISDDLDEPDKWLFPDMVIEADEYLLVWASDKDRRSLGTPRTWIQQGDDCRYRLGSAGIPSDWNTADFDDSSWQVGSNALGYGDGDDLTVLPSGTQSVYVRNTFQIANPELVTDLILDIDYDDAYVAYINGTEVARANIVGTPPSPFATSLTDREARMYSGGSPERTLISDVVNLLQTGENVLAIQVHNISSGSSDLSIIAFASARYAGATTDGVEPPQFLGLAALDPHTNFKLSSEGEGLYLFNDNGQLIDSLSYDRLLSDVSYGNSNMPGERTYFATPTPEAPNSGDTFAGIINSEIEFSHLGGSTQPVLLSLDGAAPGETIRYTLNATEPHEGSPVYANPLWINANRVVRAKIFREDYLSGPSESRSFLIDVAHDLPIVALTVEPDDFFHPITGMYILQDGYQGDFPYFGSNIWEDWERPIHVSIYEPDGQLGVAFNGGTKIFGGWSRANEQRSLSIFARNRYGASEIDYPIFDSRPYDTYQAMVLRNSGNDWLNTMLRDGALTSLMEGSGLDIQAYRPAVTYLNGQYWGIYNMREKVNEHFLAARHGLDPDKLDILERDAQVVHGTNEEYLELIQFINTNNLLFSQNYDYVASQVDIDNFILYQVAQIYFDNTDWPGNNIKFWKPEGGKWRWILFDTDFGFGPWNQWAYLNNTLDFALDSSGPGWPNPPWSTLLFRRLMDNQEFERRFINRFADEMNSRFLPIRVADHIDAIAAHIESEIPAHFQRWGVEDDNWTNKVTQM